MADSFSPPEGVRAEARRALKWIEEGHAGGGFTDVGRKRASDLARGASVSLRTIKRMNSFLARHEVDKQGKGWAQGSEGYPSAGRVSWAAWGGDAGKAWAGKILRSVEKSVDAIASDPMQMDLDMALGWAEGEIAWEELPENVRNAIDEAMVDEIPEQESVDAMMKAEEQTELVHKADVEHRFTLGPLVHPEPLRRARRVDGRGRVAEGVVGLCADWRPRHQVATQQGHRRRRVVGGDVVPSASEYRHDQVG